MAWRTTPPAVSLKNPEAVLEQIQQLKLTQFIRTTSEINKEALLADPKKAESIKGVTITQKEEFVVTPHKTNVEIKGTAKKKK